jgi:flagellar export protein FliJ
VRKTLSVLNRLNAWRLDQQRRALAKAQSSLDQADENRRLLASEIAHEQACAAKAPLEAGRAYAAYATEAKRRNDALQRVYAEASREEAAARHLLKEAFLESKRTEVLTENRRQQREAETKTRETQSFDEIAVSRYTGWRGEG